MRDALWLINGDGVGGVLSLSDFIPPDPNSPNSTPLTVLDVLRSKPPSPQQALEEALVDCSSEVSCIYPVIFERIDAKCIRSAALKSFGSGGPSRTDAYCWRRLCTSFGNSSEELYEVLSLVAKRLYSFYVHPDGIKPLLACRLIALDKKPGVRPIGVSE